MNLFHQFIVGFFVIVSLLFSSLSLGAPNKKRYKQRNNKITTHVGLSVDSSTLEGPIQFSYARNFRRFEVGAFVGLNLDASLNNFVRTIRSTAFNIGVLAQFNLLSNERVKRQVASLGVEIGGQYSGQYVGFVSPFLSYEYFLNSRNSIQTRVLYDAHFYPLKPFVGVDLNIGFTYYFH